MRIVVTLESDEGRIEERDAVTVTDEQAEEFRRRLRGESPSNYLAWAAHQALKAVIGVR